MEHADFRIGLEFYTATGLWRCTDVGTRTIVAVKFDGDGLEYVFDEYDFGGCDLDFSRWALQEIDNVYINK